MKQIYGEQKFTIIDTLLRRGCRLNKRIMGRSGASPLQNNDQSEGISGLPGLKCLRITSDSLVLRLVISTPAFAAALLTKNSSSVICPKRIMFGAEMLNLPKRPYPCTQIKPYAPLSCTFTVLPGS